jgi:hypothetical protein
MTAVIRIEIEQKTPLRFPAEYRNRVAELALQAAAAPRMSGADRLDATASQRDFYRGLLRDLRQRLPRRCRCPGGCAVPLGMKLVVSILSVASSTRPAAEHLAPRAYLITPLAIAAFSLAYADQNESAPAALDRAVRQGKVTTVFEINN